ncbi:MAG: hypothetical protein KBF88_05790, partial [Polyangiaceae bacterium]|nr:hypothetical protein [Polyangiaceae bacterium]
LGGDSILTLALMGRLHKVGASITPRAVFSGRTIRRIAEAMTEVVVLQERRPTGPLPLSPIQHWFFDAPRKSYAHYNQSVLITLPQGTDATRLRQAFVETVEHHALGILRFYQKDGAWHQESLEHPVPPEWTEHLLEKGLADLEPHAQEVQRSLCLEEGRLLRGVVYRTPDRSPARLLLVAHHLMVDAVSWRILLADLESAYRGNPLGPHARSYASFAHELPGLARAHEGERDYWLRAAQPTAPVSTDSLLLGPGTAKRSEIVWLGSAHATPQELVVAGLVGAWLRHSKSDTCVIDLEGHGRSFAAEIDLSSVVGWFTALYPVRFTIGPTELSVGQSPSPSVVLHAVRESLSQVPHGGVGFGLLKHVLADSDLAKAPTPPIVLNYLGTLDTMVAGEFRPAPEGRGDESDPNERNAHPLEVNAYLLEGKLTVDWQGPAKWIESLEPHFVENLRVLQADAPSKIRGESLPALNERSALKPVQLAEGPLAPIVLFAPVGGDVGAYAHFASHFQGERAVWAFPLEGDLASLLDSKDVLEAALAALTKDGPCIVGGWSMGALIAMHASSKRTSGLLLALDQTPREKAGEVDTASILAEVLAPWGDASSLRGLSLEEQLSRALELAEKHAHPLRFVERSVLKQRVQIARNNFATLAKFDPPKTQLRVLSVAAIADRPGRSAEQVRAEWEGYADHVHVECIDANHLDLLSVGHAKSVAELVRREIRKGAS